MSTILSQEGEVQSSLTIRLDMLTGLERALILTRRRRQKVNGAMVIITSRIEICQKLTQQVNLRRFDV